MKNFDYLKDIPELKDLYFFCNNAEETLNERPNTSALNSRMALEWVVKAIYSLKHIEVDDRDSLYELMTGDPFTSFIGDDRLMSAAHYVRNVGNKSAHQGNVKGGEAFFSLLNLYNLVGSVLLKLGVIKALAPLTRTSFLTRLPSPYSPSVACLLVLPCGRSAHTEAGWMAGMGKRVIVYIPEMQEPELMYKLFDEVVDNLDDLVKCFWYEGEVKDYPLLTIGQFPHCWFFSYICNQQKSHTKNIIEDIRKNVVSDLFATAAIQNYWPIWLNRVREIIV